MEWKIGEIKRINGEWYQCVEGNGCENCAFKARKCYLEGSSDDPIGECCYDRRRDNKDVIFKKLEKVGGPFQIGNRKIIKIQSIINNGCKNCIFAHDNNIDCNPICDKYGIYVELKQNKEDMEEKKQNCDGCKYSDEEMKIIEKAKKDVRKAMGGALGLPKDISYLHSFVSSALKLGWLDKYTKHSNTEKIGKDLRPFDLEAAKSGKPVCTRDGRKARIICFDKDGGHPIIALVKTKKTDNLVIEDINLYFINGRAVSKDIESKDDLMMLPEKKEGWAVIFKDDLLKTEQDAKDLAEKSISEVVRIEKIEYEE